MNFFLRTIKSFWSTIMGEWQDLTFTLDRKGLPLNRWWGQDWGGHGVTSISNHRLDHPPLWIQHGSLGRDSGEKSRQVVHGLVTACEEERNSKIRPQDILMGTYRNHLWHAVFNSFPRTKCRFINSFFRHGSIGYSFSLRLPKAGARVLNEDLRLWGTVKTSKVNYLTWPVRYLRQRRERTSPEVESRIDSIPDNSVHISAPN